MPRQPQPLPQSLIANFLATLVFATVVLALALVAPVAAEDTQAHDPLCISSHNDR